MFSSTVVRDKSTNQANVMKVLALDISYSATVVLQKLLFGKANSYYKKMQLSSQKCSLFEEFAVVNVTARILD
jgi:hypothetical protein